MVKNWAWATTIVAPKSVNDLERTDEALFEGELSDIPGRRDSERTGKAMIQTWDYIILTDGYRPERQKKQLFKNSTVRTSPGNCKAANL